MARVKHRKRETLISFGLAAILIAAGTIILGGFLHYAIGAEEGVQGFQETPGDLPSLEPQVPVGLNTIVYTQGNTLPEDAVSAQYAIALTSVISERAYGKPLTGRVFCRLEKDEHFGEHDNYLEFASDLAWEVQAEQEGGFITVTVDPMTGIDVLVSCSAGENAYFGQWFDEWSEEAAEQKRLENEARIAEMMANSDPNNALQPISEEQWVYVASEKARGLKEWIATMTDSPYGAQAVEAVNKMGLGNGAQAVKGTVSMMGSLGGDDYHSDTGGKNAGSYMIEVTLDNGKYLFVEFKTDDATVMHYERHNLDFLTTLYGPENA